MATSGLTLNGTDAGTYGFTVSGITGYLGATTITNTLGTVPGRQGQRLLAPSAEPPRTINITGWISGATVAQCRGYLDTLTAVLKAKNGTVRLGFQDLPGRDIGCLLQGIDTPTPTSPQFIARRIQVTLKLLALDPYYYDTSTTTLSGIGTALVRAAIGDAPVAPVWTLTGASTNPVFTLYDGSGTQVATLGLTITTVAGDTLVVDMDKKTITKNGANVINTISSGDFWALDLNAADYAASSWPQVAVSSGSASLSYKRAWR